METSAANIDDLFSWSFSWFCFILVFVLFEFADFRTWHNMTVSSSASYRLSYIYMNVTWTRFMSSDLEIGSTTWKKKETKRKMCTYKCLLSMSFLWILIRYICLCYLLYFYYLLHLYISPLLPHLPLFFVLLLRDAWIVWSSYHSETIEWVLLL